MENPLPTFHQFSVKETNPFGRRSRGGGRESDKCQTRGDGEQEKGIYQFTHTLVHMHETQVLHRVSLVQVFFDEWVYQT